MLVLVVKSLFYCRTAQSQITPCVSEPWVLVLRRAWSGLDVGWASESVVGVGVSGAGVQTVLTVTGKSNLLNSSNTIYLFF